MCDLITHMSLERHITPRESRISITYLKSRKIEVDFPGDFGMRKYGHLIGNKKTVLNNVVSGKLKEVARTIFDEKIKRVLPGCLTGNNAMVMLFGQAESEKRELTRSLILKCAKKLETLMLQSKEYFSFNIFHLENRGNRFYNIGTDVKARVPSFCLHNDDEGSSVFNCGESSKNPFLYQQIRGILSNGKKHRDFKVVKTKVAGRAVTKSVCGSSTIFVIQCENQTRGTDAYLMVVETTDLDVLQMARNSDGNAKFLGELRALVRRKKMAMRRCRKPAVTEGAKFLAPVLENVKAKDLVTVFSMREMYKAQDDAEAFKFLFGFDQKVFKGRKNVRRVSKGKKRVLKSKIRFVRKKAREPFIGYNAGIVAPTRNKRVNQRKKFVCRNRKRNAQKRGKGNRGRRGVPAVKRKSHPRRKKSCVPGEAGYSRVRKGGNRRKTVPDNKNFVPRNDEDDEMVVIETPKAVRFTPPGPIVAPKQVDVSRSELTEIEELSRDADLKKLSIKKHEMAYKLNSMKKGVLFWERKKRVNDIEFFRNNVHFDNSRVAVSKQISICEGEIKRIDRMLGLLASKRAPERKIERYKDIYEMYIE